MGLDPSPQVLMFATTGSADIVTAVREVLGAGATTSLPDCGQGPRSSYTVKGFSLLLQGNRWVGWSDREPGLTTADGLGVGTSLVELQRLRPAVVVSEESLAAEFYESETTVNGFLSGRTPDSTVTSVYAGESCVFR